MAPGDITMPKYSLLAHYRGGPEPRHPFPPHGHQRNW